ncbi:MAG: hypothetical protein HQL46_09935 [Gammaproteobacteria bacterium]|nr:hypothetical protein [Gammaproteobacteria bacterium]
MDKKRLLMEIERLIRDTNRTTLNPLFPEFSPAHLEPSTQMIADARAEYLLEFSRITQLSLEGQHIGIDEVRVLRDKRMIYDELIAASQALDTAIKRGYLDIE